MTMTELCIISISIIHCVYFFILTDDMKETN